MALKDKHSQTQKGGEIALTLALLKRKHEQMAKPFRSLAFIHYFL